ncbi:MAG: patatin-like phospholipase family protein [Gemmatimonadaceae bacterium]
MMRVNATATQQGPEPATLGRRVALVLGGGGLKGFAHIGVMRALEERGIAPQVYAGTSIGALMAAAAAGRMPNEEMARRATSLRRRDLFRINHIGMLMERMRSPAVYLEEPLRELVRMVVPQAKFDQLPHRLLVNTVDAERGTQVVWGLPGLEHASVQDAVYASCALPGLFPPGRVAGRICFDGGVIDNLPANIASVGMDLVVAVDVGTAERAPMQDVHSQGFAAVYVRAATIMMYALQQFPLDHWNGPPMVLIRPKLPGRRFDFGHAEAHIDEGYRAAMKALEGYEAYFDRPGSIFPRRSFKITVDRDKCTSCGLCATLAPQLMGLDSSGKAFPRTTIVDWSPSDGDFVAHCPTEAIDARKLDRTPAEPKVTPDAA